MTLDVARTSNPSNHPLPSAKCLLGSAAVCGWSGHTSMECPTGHTRSQSTAPVFKSLRSHQSPPPSWRPSVAVDGCRVKRASLWCNCARGVLPVAHLLPSCWPAECHRKRHATFTPGQIASVCLFICCCFIRHSNI